jgi:hypothetical protein
MYAKTLIFAGILKATDEKSRIRSRIRYSEVRIPPDPYHYVPDTQHWFLAYLFLIKAFDKCYGSPAPDPYQNVPDPQHWFLAHVLLIKALDKVIAFPSRGKGEGEVSPGRLPAVRAKILRRAV